MKPAIKYRHSYDYYAYRRVPVCKKKKGTPSEAARLKMLRAGVLEKLNQGNEIEFPPR